MSAQMCLHMMGRPYTYLCLHCHMPIRACVRISTRMSAHMSIRIARRMSTPQGVRVSALVVLSTCTSDERQPLLTAVGDLLRDKSWNVRRSALAVIAACGAEERYSAAALTTTVAAGVPSTALCCNCSRCCSTWYSHCYSHCSGAWHSHCCSAWYSRCFIAWYSTQLVVAWYSHLSLPQ